MLTTLVCVVSISFGATFAKKTTKTKPFVPKGAKEKLRLSFLKDKSCGKLFVITQPAEYKAGDLILSYLGEARGDVLVPPLTLVQLNVGNAVISDLSFLKNVNPKPIAAVRFRMQEVPDSQFHHLAHLTELESLDADSTDLSDSGLIGMSSLRHMKYLRASRAQIRGDGLSSLKGWDELIALRLAYNDLKPGCLKKLPRLKGLKKIELDSTGVGDSDLFDLKGMPVLNEIQAARNSRITDKGMAALLEIPTLELLDLSFTSTTVKGLKTLSKLPNLRHMTVSFEKLKPLGVYELRRALPNCDLVDNLQHTNVPIDFFK